MDILFLGTRGNTKVKSGLHIRHASCLILHSGKKLMIDCGKDWLDLIFKINPDALLITHAHPDHAQGLKNGSPCPVYATQDTWDSIGHYPIKQKYVIQPQNSLTLCSLLVEAFAVEHSIRAPAVGYKIISKKSAIFYVPDLVYIYEQEKALAGIDLYIGDGARINRPLIRKRDSQLIGHTTIKEQLAWCVKTGVPRALFTHCGTQLIVSDQDKIHALIDSLSKDTVPTAIAYDGLLVKL